MPKGYVTSPKSPSVNAPEWLRTAFVEDDLVFLPAAVCGNEEEVILCASWDGVHILFNENHAYVPFSWIIKEYPSLEEDLKSVADTVLNLHRLDREAAC